MKLGVQRLGVLAVLAVALAGGLTAAAAAAVSGSDAAATRTFLTTGERYLTHSVRAKSHIQANAKAFVDQVSGSCQNSLAGARASGGTVAQRGNLSALEAEAQADFSLIAIDTLRAPLAAAVRSLAHLHWSRASVTRGVTAFVRGAREILAIEPTNICADIRAAAGTSFAQLSSTTTRFLHALSRVPSAPSWSRMLKLVAPFETALLRARAVTVRKLDAKAQAATDSVLEPEFNRLGTVLLGPGA